MPKSRKNTSEINDIKQDLDSLKSNVVALTRHLEENGVEKMHELGERAKLRVKEAKARGAREYHNVEEQVRARPGQSIAIAFAAGILASQLIRRY